METTKPCTRHAAQIWMARCPECTEWHLPHAVALRTERTVVRVRTAPAAAPARGGSPRDDSLDGLDGLAGLAGSRERSAS